MTSVMLPFGAGLVLAAVHDVKARRVPNALTLAFLAIGIGVRLLLGGPLEAGSGLLGALMGGGLLFIPFALNWLGAGDVKLAAAIGAWLGPVVAFQSVVLGLLGGGVLALGMTLANRTLRRDVPRTLFSALLCGAFPSPERRVEKGLNVPLAAALAVGAVVAALVHGGLPHA